MTITELAALWDWEELTVKYDLTTDYAIEQFFMDLEARKHRGMSRTIQFVDADEDLEPEKKKRTGKQNRSLHKYLTLLAKALNDAGWDQRKTLKEEVEIPWNEWSAKEFLWRGIQKAMYGTESTTELDTAQCQEVYKVLDRHLASKTGVSVAWPSEDSMRMDSYGL